MKGTVIKYGYDDGKRGCEAKYWIDGKKLKVKVHGSDHYIDWLANLIVCPLRKGWHRMWYKWGHDLARVLSDYAKNNNLEKVELIGLSAGGAIAVVVGNLLSTWNDWEITVTTVNSPSPGSQHVIDASLNKFPLLNLSHRGDIVSQLPPFYGKLTRKWYGKRMVFWKAHLDMPAEWKNF